MKERILKSLGIIALASSLYAGDSYSLALVNMGMDYREYNDAGEILDSEKSNSIIGVEFGYGFDLECSNDGCPDLEFKALILKGDTEYLGSIIGSGQPYGSYKSTTSNFLYDLSLDWTQTDKFKKLGFTYGVGFGYHSWYRELSSTQNELYHWFYLTPILGVSTDITKEFNVGVMLKYKYGLSPRMEANTIADDFRLGGADTFEVNIPILYKVNDEIELFGTYTYAQQKIKKSNYVSGYINGTYYTTIHEPDSTDNQQYFKLGIKFKY